MHGYTTLRSSNWSETAVCGSKFSMISTTDEVITVATSIGLRSPSWHRLWSCQLVGVKSVMFNRIACFCQVMNLVIGLNWLRMREPLKCWPMIWLNSSWYRITWTVNYWPLHSQLRLTSARCPGMWTGSVSKSGHKPHPLTTMILCHAHFLVSLLT